MVGKVDSARYFGRYASVETADPADETRTLASAKDAADAAIQKRMQCLERLQKEHPDLQIELGSAGSRQDVASMAKHKFGMYRVTIAEEALDAMADDDEVYQYYHTLLGTLRDRHDQRRLQAALSGKQVQAVGTVIDAEGQVTDYTAYTTPPPQKNEMQTEAEKAKNRFKIKYSYNYGGTMQQLAARRTVNSVKGLVASQRMEISNAKRNIDDPSERAAAIRKIKAVIQKGEVKVARLRREEQLDKARRSAAKKAKYKMAEQLRRELRDKRAARRGEERLDTIDHAGILEQAGSGARAQYDRIVQEYTASMTAGSVAAVGTTGGTVSVDLAAGGGMPISSGVEVSV